MRRIAVLATAMVGLMMIALVVSGTVSARASRTIVRCGADDLQTAIDAAPRNATLIVRGTCVGNFTIAHDVRLRGFGPATLQGDGGTVVTIAEGADVVLTDLIVTGGSADALAPERTRTAGIYNGGSLVLDGRTSVQENSNYHCGPNDSPEGPCALRYPGIIHRTGGVFNVGSLLLTDRARIENNNGRGVFNLGTMTMRRWASIANNNMPVDGAGVLNYGTATMHDRSAISGNRAMSRAGTGAGVHNTGTFTMNDRSSIHDNEVRQNGGGVYNRGTLTLNDRSSIRNNVSHFTGGGVWVAGITIIRGRAAIAENEAGGGGGIFVWDGGRVYGSLRGVTGNTPDDCYGCPTPSVTPTAVPRTSTRFPTTRTVAAATQTASPTAVATRAVTPTAGAADASATPTTPSPTPTPVRTPALYISVPRFGPQTVGEPAQIIWTIDVPTIGLPSDFPKAVPDYTLMVWRLTFDRTFIDVVAFESQSMDCTFAWLDAAETQLEARCIPPASDYLGDALTITTVCLKPYGRGTGFDAPWGFPSGFVMDRGVEVHLGYIGSNYTNVINCSE